MTIPGPGEVVEFPRHNYDPQKYKRAFAYLRNRTLAGVALAGAAVTFMAGLAGVGELAGHRKGQVPYFQTFEMDDCYVTNDAKWVYPQLNRGIDDLAIRNISGVSWETGPGARCLEAAREVIIMWSKIDGRKYNDITTDGSPIVIYREPYQVPLEVSPEPIK